MSWKRYTMSLLMGPERSNKSRAAGAPSLETPGHRTGAGAPQRCSLPPVLSPMADPKEPKAPPELSVSDAAVEVLQRFIAGSEHSRSALRIVIRGFG